MGGLLMACVLAAICAHVLLLRTALTTAFHFDMGHVWYQATKQTSDQENGAGRRLFRSG
jgi:hypothetical protein